VQAVWNGFIGYLPNLFSIAIILTIASSLLLLARWLSANIRRGRLQISGFYPEWALPTYRLVQVLLVAVTFALVFPYLPGAESPAFQGVSIFFGLLVSRGALFSALWRGLFWSIPAPFESAISFVLPISRALWKRNRCLSPAFALSRMCW
jgi:hypothetical protein